MSRLPGSSLPHNSSSASLVNSTAKVLADSDKRSQVDGRILEYLTMEMVDVLELSVSSVLSRERIEESMEPSAEATSGLPRIHLLQTSAASEGADTFQTGSLKMVRSRIERMGYGIGSALADKLTRERPPFSRVARAVESQLAAPSYDPLEVVKFLCKDLWMQLYDKQIDNLRTNHRGVFVLHDNAHKPLLHFSTSSMVSDEQQQASERAMSALQLPCGIIRGALTALGLPCTVTSDLANAGQCSFQIKLQA